MKATQGDTSSPPDPPGTSIQRALHGNSSSVPSFGPAVLLVTPGTVNPWLEENQPPSLSDTCYKKWVKELKLPQYRAETLEKNIEKVMQWWSNQPDSIEDCSTSQCSDGPGSAETEVIHYGRVGHQGHDGCTDSELVTSFLLRSKGSTAKQVLKDLSVARSCILSLALLTPFTLSPSNVSS